MGRADWQTIELLREAHAALDGLSDTDISHLTEDEERESAPAQYAARRVMQAIEALTDRAEGELLRELDGKVSSLLRAMTEQRDRIDRLERAMHIARRALSDIKRAADTAETPTNRLRFIAARAQAAMEGRQWDARAEGVKGYHIRKPAALAQGNAEPTKRCLRPDGCDDEWRCAHQAVGACGAKGASDGN